MKKELNTENLRDLVAQNKTAKALDHLVAYAPDIPTASLRDEIFILNSRWKKIKADERGGFVSDDHNNRAHILLNRDLLALLTQLEAPSTGEVPASSAADKSSEAPGTTYSLKQILTGIAAVIAVLAGIAELTGYSLRDYFTEEPVVIVQDSIKNETPQQTDTSHQPSEDVTGGTPKEATPAQTDKTLPATTKNNEVPPPKATLELEIKTNSNSQELVFEEGEEIRLYFKVTRPCILRTIYQFADGTLILLDNDRPVTSAETQRWVELGDGFEVAEPFGAEKLYIFAQDSDFPALVTEQSDGYTIILEGLPSSLRKTRGLKKKQAFAESQLSITTKTR